MARRETVGDLELFTVGQRRYARFATLAAIAGLRHAFTTRGQDVSARSDENAARRGEKRRQAARDLGLNPDRIHYCRQIHEPTINEITEFTPPGPLEATDGLITGVRGATLATFSADCPLILLCCPRTPALGMAHASWRCTAAEVTMKLVRGLVEAYGCDPERLYAGIGPSAGPESYEVQSDVHEAMAGMPNRDAHFIRRRQRMYFDLWSANRAQLELAGVPPEHIAVAEVDTMQRTDLFYSYRREGPGCGHFALLAGLV